jgi:6-phosphogluconate dehydrogenase
LERGYCMMIGGDQSTVERLNPIFKTLAPGPGEIPRTAGRERSKSTAEQGYLYCGASGSGHFVKMVHNGIEYGLMQAYAEGFDILRGAHSNNLPAGLSYDLNLADIAELWRRGSVISSWLLDLMASALASDAHLDAYTGFVEDSGEGRWTIAAALEEGVSAEVLSAALYTRFRSRQEHTFAEKVLSAMRKGFGGHVERPPAIKIKQGL